MSKQVDKSHYNFDRYMTKQRWASLWHQLDEVLSWSPQSVLEVGPGPGIFKAVGAQVGLSVKTFDIDPELKPDHLGSVLDMQFSDGSFDVVCAFQMLEHLPFEQATRAFGEMSRVAKHAVVISLPDAATQWPVSIYVPKFGLLQALVPVPRFRKPHLFDGEHHWEVNKAGFALNFIVDRFLGQADVALTKTFCVHENRYHRFFVFRKESDLK